MALFQERDDEKINNGQKRDHQKIPVVVIQHMAECKDRVNIIGKEHARYRRLAEIEDKIGYRELRGDRCQDEVLRDKEQEWKYDHQENQANFEIYRFVFE